MDVQIEETTGLRRATASIRQAGVIHVKLPRHWARDLKKSVVSDLVRKIERKDQLEKALLQKADQQHRISIATQTELESYVQHINTETFRVPLGKIQIGYARYNHLAQVNLRTHTMTVSRYCLKEAPVDALRYLIIHELAHYFEAGHGPRFWALVEKHVPDYRIQSRIMKAFHHQSVIHETLLSMETDNASLVTPNEANETPITLSRQPLRKKPKKANGSKPLPPSIEPDHRVAASSPAKPSQATPQPTPPCAKKMATALKKPNNNKTGQWLPGLVKQLQVWIEQ